jgi:hypothetical protein
MPVQTQMQVRRGTASSWTSTNPTLAAGELGFETDTGKFKIGNGSSTWTALLYAGGGQSSLTAYQYTATAGQTTFSGADVNSNTLSYTVGAIQVYLNGALLANTTDYAATSGTSVVLTGGAGLGDSLTIISFATFDVANTYTQAQADALFIADTIVDAKGDIIAATAADAVARLAVGSNGTVLTADSSTATGLKWAAPAGGGKVLQVINATYSTQVSSSSSTFIDTGLTATITPSSATSKVLVFVSQSGLGKSAGSSNNRVSVRLLRAGSPIIDFAADSLTTGTSLEQSGSASTTYLDSPATTSATIYKTQFCSPGNTASAFVQYYGSVSSTITLLEIGA